MRKNKKKNGILKERGGIVGRAFMYFFARFLGSWSMHIFALPSVLYFLTVIPSTRRNLLNYWSCIFPGKSKLYYLYCIYRQYYQFGKILFDRIILQSGKDLKIAGNIEQDNINRRIINNVLDKNKTMLVLCSHIGGYNLYRLLADLIAKPVNIVMYGGQTRAFTTVDNVNRRNIKYINPDNPMNTVFLAVESLQNDEIVAIMGDRFNSDSKHSSIMNINGFKLNMPLGPWYIAHTANAPVVCIFIVKTAAGYQLIVKEPILIRQEEENKNEKEENIKQALSIYTGYLTQIIRQYPFQWFNFANPVIVDSEQKKE